MSDGGGLLNINRPDTKSFKIIFDDLVISGIPWFEVKNFRKLLIE